MKTAIIAKPSRPGLIEKTGFTVAVQEKGASHEEPQAEDVSQTGYGRSMEWMQ
jgi:hypothetical protein